MTDTSPSSEQSQDRRRGRPKKENSLTKFLEKVFEEERELDGRVINTKELVAEYVRGAITKGSVTLVSGEVYRLSSESWLDLIKWAYNRIDGQPIQQIEADTEHRLFFDAPPTVELDYLPDPNVVDADEVVAVI